MSALSARGQPPVRTVAAVPLVVASIASLAARHSVVLRKPAALGQAAQVTTAIVDKSGALISGRARVVRVRTINGVDARTVLRSAACAGTGSSHPLIQAILVAATRIGSEGADTAEGLVIDWHAELSPEDMVALVKRLEAAGHTVAFVGDGLNDGPALAAASLEIAAGSASDLTRSAAAIEVCSRADWRGSGRGAHALSVGDAARCERIFSGRYSTTP